MWKSAMIAAVFLAAGVGQASAQAKAEAARPAPAQALHALFAEDWAAELSANPLAASARGDKAARSLMPDVSPAAAAARLKGTEARLKRLGEIDRARLSHQDGVSAALFETMLSDRLALGRFREWRMPINSEGGFTSDMMLMHQGQPFQTVEDYEAYVARLRAVGPYVDQQLANMRQGVKEGFVLPAAVMPGALKTIAAQQFAKPEDVPLYQPFTRFGPGVPEAERARLAGAGKAAIAEAVIPALARVKAYLEGPYAKAARKSDGISEVPEGGAYYAALIKYFVTLPLSADDIHQTGLKEVARIRKEMDGVIAETGFKGAFPEFLAYLRTDPKFYARTPDELLKEARDISKRIDHELPRFFGTLPRRPYGVVPVPAALAPHYTIGRYNAGSPDGTTAGEYWVNTTKLETRPLYALPALTLHEAVPGHHLQIALTQELPEAPDFREDLYIVVFGEGWALYAEKLGREMGIYRTPYEEFGRLSYEMWRAARLVVDTGIHAKGWSRQKAIDFLAGNTALALHEVETEVDRYISWPGQALGYKPGEMKIVELRAKAEKALGPRFEIRRFHDAVLANGSLTLALLETEVDRFIAAEQAR